MEYFVYKVLKDTFHLCLHPKAILNLVKTSSNQNQINAILNLTKRFINFINY